MLKYGDIDMTITAAQKIQIAKDFIRLHKNANVTDWQPVGTSDDNKYLTIYDNLVGDVYGETRPADEGDLAEFTLEINRFHSHTGNPILFDFLRD